MGNSPPEPSGLTALFVRPLVWTLLSVCAPTAGAIPGVGLAPPTCAGAAWPPPDAAAAGPANSIDAVDRAAPIAMANLFNGLLSS